MSWLDLAVALAIVVGLGWPMIQNAFIKLVTKPGRAASAGELPPGPSDVEAWRQQWSSILISLIDDLESGEGHFSDPTEALRLTRELLWEVIGGEPDRPVTAKEKKS